MTFDEDEARSGIITVGDGRGFVVQGERNRLVITAAHCLPHLPPAASISYLSERTYDALLAPLGGEPSIAAECLFVDPVSDIAVLESPDNQVFPEDAETFDQLVDGASAFRIKDPGHDKQAWLLLLDGKWSTCLLRSSPHGGPFWIHDAHDGIYAGMSGSPIVAPDGGAVGVVCSGRVSGDDSKDTEGGPNPRLVDALAAGFLRQLQANAST